MFDSEGKKKSFKRVLSHNELDSSAKSYSCVDVTFIPGGIKD